MTPLTQAKRTLAQAARQRLESTEGGPFLIVDRADQVVLRFDLPAPIAAPDPRLTVDRLDPTSIGAMAPAATLRVHAYRITRVRTGMAGRLTDRPDSPWLGRVVVEIGLCVRHLGEPGTLLLAQVQPEEVRAAAGDRWFGRPMRFGATELAVDSAQAVTRAGAALRAGETDVALRWSSRLITDAGGEADTSCDDALLERHTAFTLERGLLRLERSWSASPSRPSGSAGGWLPVRAELAASTLLASLAPWAASAVLTSGWTLPGVAECHIGRPRCAQGPACAKPWPIDALPATKDKP